MLFIGTELLCWLKRTRFGRPCVIFRKIGIEIRRKVKYSCTIFCQRQSLAVSDKKHSQLRNAKLASFGFCMSGELVLFFNPTHNQIFVQKLPLVRWLDVKTDCWPHDQILEERLLINEARSSQGASYSGGWVCFWIWLYLGSSTQAI